jgi:hypothetical protein
LDDLGAGKRLPEGFFITAPCMEGGIVTHRLVRISQYFVISLTRRLGFGENQ